MTLATVTRRCPLLMLASALLILVACNKPKPPADEVLLPSEHIAPSPVGTSLTVLQKTFAVKKRLVTFPFDIPSHAVRPHLHGIFESFAREVHGASDDSANIDFLIVNQEQYAALVSDRPSEALMSVEDSHDQAVNFDLPASVDRPVKYYLVFRNSSAGGKLVEANFRVDF
jgi:hypothetical protein